MSDPVAAAPTFSNGRAAWLRAPPRLEPSTAGALHRRARAGGGAYERDCADCGRRPGASTPVRRGGSTGIRPHPERIAARCVAGDGRSPRADGEHGQHAAGDPQRPQGAAAALRRREGAPELTPGGLAPAHDDVRSVPRRPAIARSDVDEQVRRAPPAAIAHRPFHAMGPGPDHRTAAAAVRQPSRTPGAALVVLRSGYGGGRGPPVPFGPRFARAPRPGARPAPPGPPAPRPPLRPGPSPPPG